MDKQDIKELFQATLDVLDLNNCVQCDDDTGARLPISRLIQLGFVAS